MGDITLRQALEEYKDIYMASRNFSQRTRIEYLNDIEDLIGFLEKLGVREAKNISIPQLERYLAELDRRGNAGSTRKRKVVSIRSFLWYLYQDQYIRLNLAKKLIPPFAETKSPRYLTKSECGRLLAVASQSLRDYALIQLLLQTGIKLSELTQLIINDVEFPSRMPREAKEAVGYLNIPGSRSKKGRKVQLNSKACIPLANYLAERNATPNMALFTNRFGEQLSPRGVEKVINKYLRQTAIKGASVQSLRHTFGIQNIIAGANLKTVQEAMGHRDSRSTSLYLSLVKRGIGMEPSNHLME